MNTSAMNVRKTLRRQLASWRQYGCLVTLTALFIVWTHSSHQGHPRLLSARHPRLLNALWRATRTTARPARRLPTSAARRVVRPTLVDHRIRTEGCTIPEFNPFDSSIKRHYHRSPNITRCHGKPNFLTMRHGFVEIFKDNLHKLSVLPDDLLCFYRELQRSQYSLQPPDEVTFYGDRQLLHFDKPLKEEFVSVECAAEKLLIVGTRRLLYNTHRTFQPYHWRPRKL